MKKILLTINLFLFLLIIIINKTTLSLASTVSPELNFQTYEFIDLFATAKQATPYDLSLNPNDGNATFSDAKKLNIGTYGSFTYESEQDTDYYFFDCYNSNTYSLKISGVISDIIIYNSSNTEVIHAQANNITSAGINIQLQNNNRYYFVLTPSSLKSGNYYISINYQNLNNYNTYTLNYTNYYGYSAYSSASSRTIYYYIDGSLSGKYSSMTHSLEYAFKEAIKLWNALGYISFVECNNSSSADIIISTSYSLQPSKKTIYGVTNFKIALLNNKKVKSSTIQFAIDENGFDNGSVDDESAIMICAHELGHTIGLAHNSLTYSSIMVENAEEMSRTFGPNDIASYNYLWNK